MPSFPPPFRVGLILTEKCDASCAHCWFDCGPDNVAVMSRYEAQSYIDEASKLSSIEWISLTGGEPMLYPTLVEGLVSYASRRNLRTELVTNCNWATSPEKALDTIQRLKDVGLNILNISADDFHQATIPFERVGYVYSAAKRLGIRMVVMTTLSRSSKLRLGEISKLLGEDIPPPSEADPGRHKAIGVESGFIPVGRGATIISREWFLDSSSLYGGCETLLRDIGVKPGGDVLPCCSASVAHPDFNIGSLNDHSLEELLEKASRRELFMALRTQGPTGFAPSIEGVYVNKCHLCYETLKTRL